MAPASRAGGRRLAIALALTIGPILVLAFLGYRAATGAGNRCRRLIRGHIIMTMSKKRDAGRDVQSGVPGRSESSRGDREAVVVTKRGRPVAEVVPVKARGPRSLKGSVKTHGDSVGPVLGAWDVRR